MSDMQIDTIIGIDPDCKKSGVSIYNTIDKSLSFKALDFPTLIEQLDQWAAEYHIGNINPVVVIEASWLVGKVNFHGGYGGVGQNIAYKVGLNHETGKKIVEMCRQYHIPYVEQRPLRHKWKKGKISAAEFNELTGHKGRSNQDERDACLIALHFAGQV